MGSRARLGRLWQQPGPAHCPWSPPGVADRVSIPGRPRGSAACQPPASTLTQRLNGHRRLGSRAAGESGSAGTPRVGPFPAVSQEESSSWEETLNSTLRLERAERAGGLPRQTHCPCCPPSLHLLPPLPPSFLSLLPAFLLPLHLLFCLPPSLLLPELTSFISPVLSSSLPCLSLPPLSRQHEDAKCHLHWSIRAWPLLQTQAGRGLVSLLAS